MSITRFLIYEPKQARYRNPTVLNLAHYENSLSPLNEMHFTNGILTDCQASPLDCVCVYWTTLFPTPYAGEQIAYPPGKAKWSNAWGIPGGGGC